MATHLCCRPRLSELARARAAPLRLRGFRPRAHFPIYRVQRRIQRLPNYQGYWNQLGMQFQEEMEALLERHVLDGLVDAPWVRTDDPESDDDDRFFAALQELVAYAFEEGARIKKEGRRFPGWHENPVRTSRGILHGCQSLLQRYRSGLVSRAH